MKRFCGIWTPKITTVNCGDYNLEILTSAEFETQKLVSQT